MAIEERKFLGTAGVQQLITNTREEISAAEEAAKKYSDSLAVNYDAAGTAATKFNELANGQVKTNTEHIGTLDNLETTAKGDLVNAINEVRNAVSVGGTAAAITMTEQTSDLGEGIAKAYVLKQGDNTVGTINIPKDMVVQSGEVVVNPEGQDAGTYIKLTLANATNDVIYVNVGTLVDIYKAKANAAQVQLVIDSSTREISATIVAGSITSTELADNAVVTAKIADGNVTKTKLSTEVQASLDKADAAYTQEQVDKLVEDVENQVYNLNKDVIEPMGVDVEALKTSLATGGATANAIADAKKAGTDASAHADELNNAMNTRVEALEAIDHEHDNMEELGKIATGDVAKWNGMQAAAEATAKSYTDGKDSAMNLRVEALEAVDHDHGNMDELNKIVSGDVAKWNGMQAAAKSYADGLNTTMNGRVEALEAVDHEHANHTQLDSYNKTQTELITELKGYADSKVAGVDLSGIATNAADIDKLEASLAEGGATANAIAAAKKAGTDASAHADALNNAMNTRVEALESVTYVEITAAEINAMFAAE